MSSCLLSCTSGPFKGSKHFPFRVDLFQKGGQSNFDEVASPKNVPIPHKAPFEQHLAKRSVGAYWRTKSTQAVANISTNGAILLEATYKRNVPFHLLADSSNDWQY